MSPLVQGLLVALIVGVCAVHALRALLPARRRKDSGGCSACKGCDDEAATPAVAKPLIFHRRL
jgi:hypothetical protein